MFQLGEFYLSNNLVGEGHNQLALVKKRIEELKEREATTELIFFRCILILSQILYKHGNPQESTKHLNQLEKELSNVNEKNENYKQLTVLVMEMKLTQGNISYDSKKFKDSLTFLLKALEIVVKEDNPNTLYQILCKIALCLKEEDSLELALEITTFAKDIPINTKNEASIVALEIQQMIKKKEEDLKKKNNPKEEDNWGEEEDWGVTDDEPKEEFKKILNMYETKKDPIKDEIFNPNHRFFQKKKEEEDQPLKPTVFKSLKEKQGNYIEWLNSLVSKHLSQEIINESIQNILSGLQYIDKFSLQWTQNYYAICWKAFNTDQKKDLVDLLKDYFTQLPDSKIKENMDTEDVKEIIAIYNISLDLLRLAGMIWNPGEPKKSLIDFQSFLDSLKKFYPNHEDSITLVKMEAICHHVSECEKERDKILPTLLNIYEKHKDVKETIPTTYSIYNLPSSLDITAQTTLLVHYYFCNISPFTLLPLFTGNEEDDYISDDIDLNQPIFVDSSRMKLLSDLYLKLPLSVLKGLVGLSLGQFTRYISRNEEQSEKELYEALFIFDKVNIYPRVPILLTYFGTKALTEYGSVLIANKKYEFGASAYHSAILNYKQIHNDYDYKLIEQLQVQSLRNQDWKRSIDYLQILLEKAKVDKDNARVFFLSEKLSEVYVERGEYRVAESYIISSIQYIKNSGQKIPSTQEFEMNLRLAELFYNGIHIEKGIDLLTKLLDHELKPLQKCLIYIKLAETYLRKRWLHECDNILNKLGPLLDKKILGEYSGMTEINVLKVAAQCSRRLGKFEEALYWVDEAIVRCKEESYSPGQMARLYYLKGKILQNISGPKCLITFPSKLSSSDTAKHPIYIELNRQKEIKKEVKEVIYQNEEDVLKYAIQSFNESIVYYKKISDEMNLAKVKNRIIRTQVEFVFSKVGMLDQQVSIPIDFKQLDEFSKSALEVSSKTSSVLLYMDSYITTAELRYLQGRIHSSKEYWTECRNLIFTLFMDECEIPMSKLAPIQFLEVIYIVLKRMIRLLFNYSTSEINDNLFVIDAYLLLHIELEQSRKKNSSFEIKTDSESDSSESEDVVEKTNKIYETKKNKKLKVTKSTKKFSMFISKSEPGGNNSSTGSSTNISETAALTDRLYERLWCAVNRIYNHYSKYTNQLIIEKGLSKLNQSTNKRIYNLINTIRKKKIGNKSNSLKNGSLGSMSEKDSTKKGSVEQIEKQMRKLSLDSGDLMILNAYLKSIGEKEETKKSDYEIYIPQIDVSPICTRLLYILHIDTVIIFYIPNLGIKVFQEFGGRRKELLGVFNELKRFGNTIKKLHEAQWLTPDQHQYLNSLLNQGRREKMEKGIGIEHTPQIIQSFQETIFKNFIFTYRPNEHEKTTKMPTTPQVRPKSLFDTFRISFGGKNTYKSLTDQVKDLSNFTVSKEPILLIISNNLQIFPWELFFDEFTTRSFSLQNELIRLKCKNKDRYIPSYFSFYSEDDQKYIAPSENSRKELIFEKFKTQSLLSDPHKLIMNETILNLPFHTPLVKYGQSIKTYKNRYPFCNFVKLSLVSEHPTQIITLVDSILNTHQYSIFLFTLSDLLDMSEAILCLLSYRPDVSLMFIPEAGMIDSMELMIDIQTHFSKSLKNENRFKFFAYCVKTIQKSLNIPCVVMNPPIFE